MRDKMRLILDTGQLMMESGADTKRTVRDMLRTAANLGIHWSQVQLHMAYTTIMMNVDDGKKSYTMFRKCYRHGCNMATILTVSELDWQALREDFSLTEYRRSLTKIVADNTHRLYARPATSLAAGIACGCFCLMFGGNLVTALYTTLAALIGWWVRFFCDRLEINTYIGIAAAAAVAALLASGAKFLPLGISEAYAMMCCTLFLIPGIPLINAVDDFLNNYLTSGMTRATYTVLSIVAMTFGLVFAVWLCGDTLSTIKITPPPLGLEEAVEAALSATAFAVLFNVPQRLLPIAAGGAVITVGMRSFLVISQGWGIAEASFAGAALLSLVAFGLSHRFHIPIFVVTIPAAIPLIPGVLLYRLFFALININILAVPELLEAIRQGVQAVLVILAIAVGVTTPDVLAHQFMEHTRQKQIKELLLKRHKDVKDLRK